MGPPFFSVASLVKKEALKPAKGTNPYPDMFMLGEKIQIHQWEKPGSSAIPFRPQRIDCSALREGTAEGSTAPRLLSVGLGNQITRERTGLRVRFFVILNEVWRSPSTCKLLWSPDTTDPENVLNIMLLYTCPRRCSDWSCRPWSAEQLSFLAKRADVSPFFSDWMYRKVR